MDKIENKVLDVSHNYYKYLMNLANVNGIGLGFKIINGVWTKEPCIHVLVEEKLDEKFLTKNNIIPKTYMGIKTDVIKRGKVRTLQEVKGVNEGIKLRPLVGGTSIGVRYNQTFLNITSIKGTLGCIVTRKKRFFRKDYFILSNNHVIADVNNVPIGTAIVQPEYKSGLEEEVAYLSDYLRIKFSGYSYQPVNYADAAIAKITQKSLISNVILQIGYVNGVGNASVGLNVKKSGMRTGLTEGKVITIGVTEKTTFDTGKSALFTDVIIADMHARTGDSGSCVLNDNNEIIGLLFSGTDTTVSMNDINHVLENLNVKL